MSHIEMAKESVRVHVCVCIPLTADDRLVESSNRMRGCECEHGHAVSVRVDRIVLIRDCRGQSEAQKQRERVTTPPVSPRDEI